MSEYLTNPNQKIIRISGKEARDTNNLYARINIQAMFEAMKALTPTNFQVWLYLAKNQDNYTFAFSPAAAAIETGLKKQALQEGIRVLEKLNYLIKRENNSNIYDFYELPKEEQDEDIEITIHKEEKDKFIF